MSDYWKCPECGGVFEKTKMGKMMQDAGLTVISMGEGGIQCPNCGATLDTQTMMNKGYDVDKSSSSSSSTSSSGGCFIATEIYGSYDSSPVLVLRQYRDEKLLTNTLGSLFVRFYYSVSPSIVKYIKNKLLLKKIIKSILDKIINKLKQ